MNKLIVCSGLIAVLYAMPAEATNYCCQSGYHPTRGVIVRHHVDVDNHNDINNSNKNANNNANHNANTNKNSNHNANDNSNKNSNTNKNSNHNANNNSNKNTNNNHADANSKSNAVSKNDIVNKVANNSKAEANNQNMVRTELTNSGNSSLNNHLDLADRQDQQQKQQQTQAQTQNQSVANSGNSSNQNQSSAEGNTTTVTVTGDTYEARRIPVATAYAPSLTAGEFTCLGSVSGGIQTGVVGLSGGKTTVDQNCVMIRQVYLLQQMGQYKAACERAKQDPSIRAAMEAAGSQCEDPNKAEPVAQVDTTNLATKQEIKDVNQKLDNYIRVDRQEVLK